MRIISRIAKALCPSLRCRTDGVDPEGVQSPHPSHAQEQFLADSRPCVAAIQTRRQRRSDSLFSGTFASRRSSVVRPTPTRQTRAMQRAGGRLDRDQERLPVRTAHALDRQEVEIGVQVVLLLPPVGVERLTEVALGVKQADGDQGDPQVAGALQMIAGQHAQAARIDRQALVQPELGGEVRDRTSPRIEACTAPQLSLSFKYSVSRRNA